MATPNPKTPAKGRTISEWDQWVADNPPLEIPAPDGSTFAVPAPEMWPDAALEALENEQVVAASRLLLGDDYDRWTATGANSAWLMTRIERVSGVSTGEQSASPG